MNPFLSVWLHPKQTARYVIEQKSLLYVITITILGYIAAGFSGLRDSALYPNFSYVWIFLISIILVPIIGFIFTLITTGIVFIVGKLLNGTGSFWDVFKAYSLTSIPAIYTGPFYILALFVDEVNAITIILSIIIFVTSVWSMVILVAAVAEAHQFSIIRSIITLIIPAIILFIFLFGLLAIIMLLFAVVLDSMP